MPTVWTIVLRVVWVALLLLSGMMTLFMFAFADSPASGDAAQKMVRPIFVITLIDFAISGWLLMRGSWWSVSVACVMVLAPPVLVFVGYRILMK